MTDWCLTNLPYDYDEDEPEVKVFFDADPREPKTWDYPGTEATVEIDRVMRTDTGQVIEFDDLPESVRMDLIEAVWDYLEEQYLS